MPTKIMATCYTGFPTRWFGMWLSMEYWPSKTFPWSLSNALVIPLVTQRQEQEGIYLSICCLSNAFPIVRPTSTDSAIIFGWVHWIAWTEAPCPKATMVELVTNEWAFINPCRPCDQNFYLLTGLSSFLGSVFTWSRGSASRAAPDLFLVNLDYL